MTDYQRQFDIAHEVVEVSQADGFKTLMKEVEEQIASIESQIERLNSEMLLAVRKGGVNSEKHVQQLIELTAYAKGLKFISKQVDLFRKKRDEASNKL